MYETGADGKTRVTGLRIGSGTTEKIVKVRGLGPLRVSALT
jgi:hypothetical protein